MKPQTNQEYVAVTSNKLTEGSEWQSHYRRFANEILKNMGTYMEKSKKFRIRKPLRCYSSIGKVMKNGGTKYFDIRFGGQSVANIKVDRDDNVLLQVTDKQAKYAKENFGAPFASTKALDWVDWTDNEGAKAFRRAYADLESVKGCGTHSEEHRIESLILDEFSKSLRSHGKLLCNIQPVRLGGLFFQLTTPLMASTHNPQLTNKQCGGGGIDVLARVVHEANCEHRIAIIELKDENRHDEPQREVMFQALSYATFIAHLLRGESKKEWYKILRFGKTLPLSLRQDKRRPCSIQLDDVPEHLHLDVVTLMPEGTSEEGELHDIHIDELDVTLHLYTMYYSKDETKENPIAFSGTFPAALKK